MRYFLHVHEEPLPPRVYRLDDPSRYHIGRRDDADISLRFNGVSRRHCILDVQDGLLRLTDTNSRNGTFVNHAPITIPVEVWPGDFLQLSHVRVEILDHPGISESAYHSLRSVSSLLVYLPGHGSTRKLRLIARGWYDHIIGMFATDRLRRLADAAVQFADGVLTADELQDLRGETLTEVEEQATISWFERGPLVLAERLGGEVIEGMAGVLRGLREIHGVEQLLATLVRDALGDFFCPFRAARDWLAWNDGTVRMMARDIYDEQDFAAMGILGDALEEAGCTDEDVLEHCRSGSPHIRGCWVLDGLLAARPAHASGSEAAATLVPC
jgi:hypothetical protein